MVPATVDREVAVQRAVHRGRDTVAVVDDAGGFLGLIPPTEVLAVLAAEHDEDLAVALSLLAACSIATLVAMALPWLLHRLGRDPAYGSGPLATVIQDLLSVLIYMVIALSLVG